MIFGQWQCYQDQILQHSSSLSFFFDIEHSFYEPSPLNFQFLFFSQNSFEQDQINFTHQISLDLTNFQPENSRLHALNTHTSSKLEVQREKSTLGQCLFSRIIIRAQAGKKLRLESIDQANWSQMAQYYVLPFAICLLPIRCLQIDGYSM